MHVTKPRRHSLSFTKGVGGRPSDAALGGPLTGPKKAGRLLMMSQEDMTVQGPSSDKREKDLSRTRLNSLGG